MKNSVQLNRKELIDFIVETVIESRKTIISEQTEYDVESTIKNDPSKKKTVYTSDKGSSVTTHEPTTGQIERAAYKRNYHQNVRDKLAEYGIFAGSLFTAAEYNRLPTEIQSIISRSVFLANKEMTIQLQKNTVTAQGQRIYVFLPSQSLIRVPEVKVCWSRKLDVAVDCETQQPIEGVKLEGFDVNPMAHSVEALFDDEVTSPLNTKYFCPAYLMETDKIPFDIRARVFKWLQKTYSSKYKKDLGLGNYKGSNDLKLLQSIEANIFNSNFGMGSQLEGGVLVNVPNAIAEYVTDIVVDLEARYYAGTWSLVAGSRDDKENSVPMDESSHLAYFDSMKDFANKLKQTDCGFGVNNENLEDFEARIRDKYAGIIEFKETIPDNWDEMEDNEKEEFLRGHNAEMSKIQRQDDIQFVIEMIGLGLTLVGAILLAIPSGGSSLAVWGGVMMASGVVIGVGSAMYDYHQGQYVLGTIGLGLELIPFAKVFKLTKLLKAVPPKTINKMFAYAMKNGPKALTAKTIDGVSGKLLYDALRKNKEGLKKMLDMESKAAEKFLKEFSSMDAMEYAFLMRTSKPFAKGMVNKTGKKMTFKEFESGLKELHDIVFANKNYFKTFFNSFAYTFSKPMKILLGNIIAMPPIVVTDCMDVEFKFFKKVNGKKRLIKQVGQLLGPAYKTTEDNINWIKWTIEPGETDDSTCMLLDMILNRMTGTPDETTNQHIENLLLQNNIQVNEKELTITIKDGDGVEKTVDLLATGEDSPLQSIMDLANGLVKAQAEVLWGDEDIYATMIYHLGNGDLDAGAEKLNGHIKNGCKDKEYWDGIDWLVQQDIYIEKRDVIQQNINSKRAIYEPQN